MNIEKSKRASLPLKNIRFPKDITELWYHWHKQVPAPDESLIINICMSDVRNFHNTTATFRLYLHRHCRTKGMFSII